MPKHRHHGHSVARTIKHASHSTRSGNAASLANGAIMKHVEKGASAYDKSFKKKS